MIVIGYQGIGKSSICGREFRYIDLRSEDFYVDGRRSEDWYKVYCNIAIRLSKAGYTVFTSSHERIRSLLKNSNEKVILCFPALELQERWLLRLRTRYKRTGEEKDYRALKSAEKYYEKNIQDLMNEDERFEKLIIRESEYDLELLLKEFLEYDVKTLEEE